MPTDLTNLIYYIIAFVFVIALIFIGARLLRGTMSKSNSKAGSFLRGRERRLGVVEAASVDGRRKLILVRRDDVEHLIMTGGPVDLVVETGIQSPQPEEPSFKPQQDDGRVVIARETESEARDHEEDL
jgi:flagellar biogenesis protein FliO